MKTPFKHLFLIALLACPFGCEKSHAQTKLNEYPAFSAADVADYLLGVDVSDTSAAAAGTTKRLLLSTLYDHLDGATLVLSNKTISGADNTITNVPFSALTSIAVTSAHLTDGTIVNADISGSAAIAYSKLNLTGAILNADLAGSIALSKLATDPLARANHTGTQTMSTISDAGALATLSAVGSAQITDGVIANADVSVSAAIAYSKLSLTGSVVNADISNSAAIGYSKLALTGGIVNADISGSAAIAYSKLNLTGAILNADLAGSIALSKLATDPLARANHTGTQLLATISDAGTLAGLSAVASAQITNGTIVNEDVNASAAIDYSKLASTSGQSKLLGRGQGSGAGAVQEIALGSGLVMTGGTLSASGSVGDPDVAHVRSDGNDGTGTGTPSAPYLTLQAAFNAGFRVFEIGEGTFASISYGTSNVTLSLRGKGAGATAIGSITPGNTTAGNLTVYLDGLTADFVGSTPNQPATGINGNNAGTLNITATANTVIASVRASGAAGGDGDGCTEGGDGGDGATATLVGPFRVSTELLVEGGSGGADGGAGGGNAGSDGTLNLRQAVSIPTPSPDAANVIGAIVNGMWFDNAYP